MRSLRGRDLLVATGNRGKMAEFSVMLGPYGVRLLSLAEFGLGEPDETASDFVGNARIKARSAFNGSGLPSLADDSGIIVEGLGGCPGIFTADWAECSTGRDFGVAMCKTWDVLESMGTCSRDGPPFGRRLFWRGRTVLTTSSSVRCMGKSSGRCAGKAAMAMIQSSCLTDMTRPLAKWTTK